MVNTLFSTVDHTSLIRIGILPLNIMKLHSIVNNFSSGIYAFRGVNSVKIVHSLSEKGSLL